MKLTFFGHNLGFAKRWVDLNVGDLVFWTYPYEHTLRVEQIEEVDRTNDKYKCTINQFTIRSTDTINQFTNKRGKFTITSSSFDDITSLCSANITDVLIIDPSGHHNEKFVLPYFMNNYKQLIEKYFNR